MNPKSKTPRVDSTWQNHDIDLTQESADPWLLASELEIEMNKWKDECKRQWLHLSNARHKAIAIQKLPWGKSEDKGAIRLANLIEEDCHIGMSSNE